MNKKKIPLLILDTNVWRYILDAESNDRVRQSAISAKVQIAMPPCILFEMFRLEDKDLRSRLLELATYQGWKRLMPEAFAEAMELQREIERLHPSWISKDADLSWTNQNYWDWRKKKGGFWDRVRTQPDQVAEYVNKSESEDIEKARNQRVAARRMSEEAGWVFHDLDLDRIVAYEAGDPGEVREAFQPWRVAGKNVFESVLRGRKDHPYYDWIVPLLDLRQIMMERDDWDDFWLRKIDATHMPRWWISWAMEMYTATRKVNTGTAFDIQLATYLVEVDHVVTADKVFHSLVQACRKYAPIQMAESHLISAGNTGIEELVLLMNEII